MGRLARRHGPTQAQGPQAREGRAGVASSRTMGRTPRPKHRPRVRRGPPGRKSLPMSMQNSTKSSTRRSMSMGMPTLANSSSRYSRSNLRGGGRVRELTGGEGCAALRHKACVGKAHDGSSSGQAQQHAQRAAHGDPFPPHQPPPAPYVEQHKVLRARVLQHLARRLAPAKAARTRGMVQLRLRAGRLSARCCC